MNPPTQFLPVGTLVNHLCQAFNCFGNRSLILQAMVLILPGKAREPWQGSHMRKTMLACCCPHAVPSWGGHCEHICTCTHASTFAEDLCSYHEYRFRQKQAKTHQEANMLQIRPSQPFLFHCRLPHPQGRIMCPFFPSFQTVVVIVTIQQASPLHQALHMAFCTHFLKQHLNNLKGQVVDCHHTGLTPVPNLMTFSLSTCFTTQQHLTLVIITCDIMLLLLLP